MEASRNARAVVLRGTAGDPQACLNAAEAFEKFVGTAYIGHKRFSLEGAETLIPLLDTMLNRAREHGVEEER